MGLLPAALCNGSQAWAGVHASSHRNDDLRDRIAGMLIGSLIGDAAGGPIEFKTYAELSQHDTSIKHWAVDEVLDDDAMQDRAAALKLLPYDKIRPDTHSYGPWTANGPAGMLTDDSRMKIVLLRSMRGAEAEGKPHVTREIFAQEMINYAQDERLLARDGYPELLEDWLLEWNLAARWVLGIRNPSEACPPVRLWGGIDTVAGQMALLPLAAEYAGHPKQAYLAAHRVGFIDNGPAKDITPAIVAGLATALVTKNKPATRSNTSEAPAAWKAMERTMRKVDPFRYAEVRFVGRPTTRWLDAAADAARRAEQKPARLFEIIEQELGARTWWEGYVNFTVCMAIAHLCRYEPLASMQLALEFGHDTDSSAQLMGALMGAVYGASIFSTELSQPVIERLQRDYDEDYTEWVNFLHGRAMRRVKSSRKQNVVNE